ncbi:MAG: hypothetical protein SPG46_04910 [Alistipes sp.]|uniref:hypothetical protein n=1 Tax=Alistipes sp. TaxID=1872444 RepID=UPI002A91DEAA|nr:hypothetical protein [Alistipes sp.]MDY5396759.1 hypothetical protein [Alistipes sp.]
MIGDFTKKYSWGMIVKAEDLLALDKYIKSIYPFVSYRIKLSNGATYTFDDFSEILEYDNPNVRKILGVYFYANTERQITYLCSDFELSMVYNKYASSLTYTIRKSSQSEIELYSHKVDELIRNFKSPYRWVNSPIFVGVLGIIISLVSR